MGNLKIAFLGGLFPKEEVLEIERNSKSQPQYAADVFQWNIINGLDCYTNEPTTLLNAVFIGSYPKRYKKAYIKGNKFNHSSNENHIDYQLSFWNIPLFKHFSRLCSYKKTIRKKILGKEFTTILGYSMTFSVVMSLIYAKKKDKNIKTCLVIPDLPAYMNLGAKKSIIDILRKLNEKFLYKQIQKIDSFVILTKHMASALNIEKKPYIVIEGISSVSEDNEARANVTNKQKNFVYTGTIQEKYGIKDLVEAFRRLPYQDIQLTICGGGDTEKYLKEIEKSDHRIHYLGILPHAQIKEIQENAYLLINPRNNNEAYTKYSFPSKTMEYMATGSPVLMYPLDGMPEEYFSYIYLIDLNDDDGFYNSLEKILSFPEKELELKGKASKEFIIREKNFKCQGKKIYDFLE